MSNTTTVIGVVGLALLALVACSSPAQIQPALNYTIGGCEKEIEATRSGNGDEVEITVEDSIIRVEQKLTYVCCAGLSLALEQEGNTLKVMETNVGEICRCRCEYRVEANISDLAPGAYQVQVWGVQYEDVHPMELLGEATVTL
jgi:hypothetical protein